MATSRLDQRGFGLIEILVGLVIGLIAILVIGNVVALFEGQKRTSTGGSDAQTNGAVAMMLLAEEIRMAGFGLTTPGLKTGGGNLFCPKGTNIYFGGLVSDPGGVPEMGLVAPVRIVDGGKSDPDQIIVARSDAEFGVLVATVQTSVTLPTITIDSNLGYSEDGQLFLIGAADGTKVCTLMQTKAATDGGGGKWKLDVSASASMPFNPPAPPTTYKTFPSDYGAGDKVVNLGAGATSSTGDGLSLARSFMYRRYVLVNSRLAVADQSIKPLGTVYTSTDSTPLVDQVVTIQAQYGIADAGSQTVTKWVEPTGDWDSAKLAANVSRIKAVRFAVVTRSEQYEKEEVSPEKLTLWTKINAGDDAAPIYTIPDRHYRYRVFSTVVPLKNVIWGKV